MLQKFWLEQLKGCSCSLKLERLQSEEFWGGRSGFTLGNQVRSKCLLDLQVEIFLSQQAFGCMSLYLGIEFCIWKSLASCQQRCEYRLRKEGKTSLCSIPTLRGQREEERLIEDTEEEPREMREEKGWRSFQFFGN